jgi:predicted Abi (CAAX) family protease
VDQLIRRLALRLWRALTTWPDAAGWRFSLAAGAASLAAMAAVGFSTGLYALHPAQTAGLPLRLFTVLIAPAIGEEAPFRGLLIPSRSENPRPWVTLLIVTAVFTAWHVVEVMTFLPAARAMFLRPSFLACAAILGLGCGLARWRTGSLWPAVALHWLAVTIWQTWLGGFRLDG